MDEKEDPYNPLDKVNLGKSVAGAILRKEALPIDTLASFDGAGIYSIYYRGTFGPYSRLSEYNTNDFKAPIYVGKAVPEGARKGTGGLDSMSGPFLFKRLKDHRKSILQTSNLSTSDFFVKYLVVDDIWIPLGESLLIDLARPLWNLWIDGFGNHDPGSGRHNQQVSSWDVLHPGRTWAKKLKPGKAENEILKQVSEYMAKI